MANKLKQRWQQDKATVNGWLAIPNGFSAEVMAQCGWDSVIAGGVPMRKKEPLSVKSSGFSPSSGTPNLASARDSAAALALSGLTRMSRSLVARGCACSETA